MSMIGKTLGTFTLEAQIGKGGMGEVYRAKDQKLGRDVAIKVLPEEFAKDTDRVARFQREAKLLASLNHPNIASIYGLEESDGTHFLVLELIEGDTLADRIKRGPIPVEESLKLALQIAEALEAAHEKGVIHRDLKPANIKVTPDGKVKVLDFGLAKAFAGDQAEVNLSHSPTLSEAATLQGVILGTAAYMSPEQARGKPVDKRTDIWAFGCVLYEMLTGKAAFQGEDVTEILAAVVKSGVNLDLLPANIHPRVREVITRCLQKEQKKRYPEISEAQYEIEKVLADPSGVFVQAVAASKVRKKVRVGLPWMAAALVLVAIVAGLAVWHLKPAESRPVMRYDYDVPEMQADVSLLLSTLAVSPDGMKIVYVANRQLYIKNAHELISRPIQGTDENPVGPFFSPDGKWIGYFSLDDDQLKTVPVIGGISRELCKVSAPGGATWGRDDTIVFEDQGGGIMRIARNGGTPETLIKSENQRFFVPQNLPDGKTLLFTVEDGGRLQVAVQSLESGKRNYLFPGGPAQYVPTGHIVYALENDLFAVPFDPNTLEVPGGGMPIISGVFRAVQSFPAHFAISDSGTLIYVPGSLSNLTMGQRVPVWVDRGGNEEPISAKPDDYGCPKISPDGTKLAIVIDSGEGEDIWIWDLFRENWTKLTTDNFDNEAPLWTRDGRHVVFVTTSNNNSVLKRKTADGTGEIEQLAEVPNIGRIVPSSWSSDGKTLIAFDQTADSEDIGLLSIDNDNKWNPLFNKEFNELHPNVSPDGKWIAYVTDETGKQEVYIRPFPDVDKERRVVSTSGGNSPLWSSDGKELFFRNGESVMAVTVETEPSLELGSPMELFRGTYDSRVPADLSRQTMWDIHPDGKRFLMMKPAAGDKEDPETGNPRKINIVLNFFEELKEKAPLE